MPDNNSLSKPPNHKWRKRLKRMVYGVFFLGLIGLLLLATTWWLFIRYLETDERKCFENVELLNGGTLAFNQAEFSVFKTFPAASFILSDIEISDHSITKSEKSLIHLEQLSIVLTFQDWWDDPWQHALIEIDTIDLKTGSIFLFKDSTGYSNLQALIKKKTSPESKKQPYKLKVETQDTEVRFSNINIELIDEIKDSRIDVTIDTLASILNIKDQHLQAHTRFIINTEQIAFNTEKGVYVPNSRLQGNCEIEYRNGNFEIQPFDLAINDECFEFSILTKLNQDDASIITFENTNTNLDAVRPLLPFTIEDKIAIYNIIQPFYSKTTIETAFEPDDHPIVTVDFELDKHEIIVDQYRYYNVNLFGKFVNRIFADERAMEEPRKRWRLEFDDLKAQYQGFTMHTDTALVTKTEHNEIDLKTQINILGKASDVSTWLQNDQFFFKNGKFRLAANIDGSLLNYDELVMNTSASLAMKNFGVYYEPAKVTFPFHALNLQKLAGDADFKIVGSTIGQQNTYQASGNIKNFPALMLATINERSKSDVELYAQKISWTDFIDLFGEHGYLSTETKNDVQKKESLKQTLRGLQYDFQPAISVLVDTLEYYDALELHNFKTGVHFQNENILVLEKTSFEYQDGQVDVSARFDISKPQRTPFELDLHVDNLDLQTLLPSLNYLNINLLKELENLPVDVNVDVKHRGILDDEKGLVPNSSRGVITFSIENGEELLGKVTYESSLYFEPEKNNSKPTTRTQINLAGEPHLFNKFFQTDQFFFRKGRFKTQVNYEGDIYDLNELLSKAKVDLSMTESEIFYAPSQVTFPIPQLDLLVKRDSAAFVFQLQSDSLYRPLDFVGNIQPISELVIGNTGQQIATNVDISSQKLGYGNLKHLFRQQNKAADTSKVSLKSNKSTIKNLLLQFNPHVHLNVDTLIYSENIVLNQLKSGLYLSDSTYLIVENTGFKFQEGNVQLYGKFDFSKTTHTPFETEFVTDDLNIGKLLEGFNYLSLPSLQSIEKLNGDINLDLHFSGSINRAGTALITKDNEGLLRFNLRNLQVVGFEPLEKLAAKILMKKRFANLRFEPIVNTFRIKGDKIFFPLTEIQSTAFNLFFEGRLSYGDDTNIWASLPLAELFFNDPDELPEKTGYHMRPLKIHAEVTSDENGENQFKLHFTKKKFYEQRGILEQYKRNRQLDRLRRKKAREAKKLFEFN